ncbi:MAG: hypothetical protein RI958_187 [Actinomycetota bacterium]
MLRGGQQFIPRPGEWRLGAAAPWAASSVEVRSVEQVLAPLVGTPSQQVAPPFPEARHSSVLVVLHDGPDGPEALFTKRSMRLRHHRGEISFPGGRMEPGETPAQAALREAWEEVALEPDHVTVRAELDHLSTVVSQSYIVPVVATVDARPELRAHEAEVDEILWVPLGELVHPAAFREERWGTPPLDRPVYFFEIANETIWGATARMLHQLLSGAYGAGSTARLRP